MLTSIQKNNVNFSSRQIHNVSLKSVSDGSDIPAVLTQLNIKRNKDIDAIAQVKTKWPIVDQIITCFCNDFRRPQNADASYFAVELKNENPLLSDRIVGLFKSRKLKDGDREKIYLSQIFSKPEYMKENPQRSIEGIGETLLAGTFKLARKIKASCLEFHSECDNFYFRTFEKAKIDIIPGENYNPKTHDFCFSEKYFDKYLNYCKKEYKINLLRK